MHPLVLSNGDATTVEVFEEMYMLFVHIYLGVHSGLLYVPSVLVAAQALTDDLQWMEDFGELNFSLGSCVMRHVPGNMI